MIEDVIDREPWRKPVDALIEFAGTWLAGDWVALLGVIREGWPPFVDDFGRDVDTEARATRRAIREARRRLLDGPKSLDPSRQKWEAIGQLNPVTTDPEELRRFIDATEREPKIQLHENRIKDAIIKKLRLGEWEGEDLAGPISRRIWNLPQLTVDWGSESIQIGTKSPRYGLRLRPRRTVVAPDNPDAAQEPPLVSAKPSEIKLVLDELYDQDVIAGGFKPPNLREAGLRGKRLLAQRGLYAPASRIEMVARDQRYAMVRLPRGDHFKR
jgi:hypothetical protein